MTTFVIKPVFWNTKNYTMPSGAKATSGYPYENGYGHEEWNNAPRMRFRGANDQPYRVFHTEPLGKFPVEEHANEIMIFMIASHGGVQYLVGVAGNARFVPDEEERRKLAKQLKLNSMWEEAWSADTVKICYRNNREKFRSIWTKKEVFWTPNWICPEKSFLWLANPLPMNANSLVGKKKFLTRFSSYQEIEKTLAGRILNLVAKIEPGPRIRRLRQLASLPPSTGEADDVEDVCNDPKLSPTQRKALINARLGQGKFRADVEKVWDRCCAVTSCTAREALRASHILPWKQANNKQRLDPHNGLLLTANIDALFDRGLISFSDNGRLLVSDQITEANCKLLGLKSQRLWKVPTREQKVYLQQHRETYGF